MLIFKCYFTKNQYTQAQQNLYPMRVYSKNLLTCTGTLKPSTRLIS